MPPNGQRSCGRRLASERGVIIAWLAVFIVGLLAVAALVIDLGQAYWVRRDLQNAADAASLAAVFELDGDTVGTAQTYAVANHPGHGQIVTPGDVVKGNWNATTRVFTPGGSPTNAVEVSTQRSGALNNPVELGFARVVGINDMDVGATAVAALVGEGTTRFLIDDEMFDTDEPAIEALAAQLGVETDFLLSDTDGDKFVQLSNVAAGEILELPTGQVGDEALFDISPGGCTFPFPGGGFTFADFVLHEVFSPIIPDNLLDPLVCVDRVDDPGDYPAFVDPDFIHVSPLYKSDVSALNPVGGDPAVNAKGERRGLIAFKILDTLPDPPGSELPFMRIQIMGPQDLGNLGPAGPEGGGVAVLVL